jgi:hypothetical protein
MCHYNTLNSAMPSVSRALSGRRELSQGGCRTGGGEVTQLAVEVLAGPVVARRAAA